MSEAENPPPQPPAPPKTGGMTAFYRGLIIAVLGAVLLGVMFVAEFRPDDKMAIAIFAIGGIAALLMLVGFFKELLHVFRTGQVKGLAVQLAIFLGVAGTIYFGLTLWNGVGIPGDELAPLIGKKRDDAEVRTAIRRLGMNHYDENKEGMFRMGWNTVEMLFDKEGTLDSIGFRINKYHPYTPGLPAGLMETDSAEDFARKLGPPDSENAEQFKKRQYFKAKKLALEWDIDSLLGPRLKYVRLVRNEP